MKYRLRCSKCKEPLDADNDVTVVCVNDTATELALGCDECGAQFSCWIDHKGGWSDADGQPVDLSVKGPAR